MRLRVTQPDTSIASAAVLIRYNSHDLSVLGPGASIDQYLQHKENHPYEVEALCGMHRATYHGHDDVELQIFWNMRDCKMELRKISGGSEPNSIMQTMKRR